MAHLYASTVGRQEAHAHGIRSPQVGVHALGTMHWRRHGDEAWRRHHLTAYATVASRLEHGRSSSIAAWQQLLHLHDSTLDATSRKRIQGDERNVLLLQ